MPTSGQTAFPVPPASGGVTLPVAVADGGTGATSAANARTNLNVPSIPVSVANGGTGATDAPTARTNLGIVGAGGWPTGAFGSASDGSPDFDGTNTFAFATKSGSIYTLSRNVWAQNVTIRAGVTVNKPWVLYVRGTLTIEATGILADNGNAAIGSAAGAQAGATRIPQGVGGLGGAGRSIAGSGANGTSIVNGHGGVGGVGGDPSGVSTGGNGGSISAPGVTANRIRDGFLYLSTMMLQSGASQVDANGGSGGGGGGLQVGSGTGTTGGGGGGAPVSALFANTIVNNGKIQNNGGAGANAVSATLDCQSGGGGGGGGGYLIIMSNTPQASAGTIEVLGGSGGTSLGVGCTNALPGNDGTLDYRGP